MQLDFTRYFDKKSTSSYAVGPSGLGVVQTGFGVLWRGWHRENEGIFIEKSELFNPRSTGTYIPGTNEILATESMSFGWDALSRVWVGTHVGNTVTVYAFSGAGYTDYTFSGIYPQMFYNSCYVSSGARHMQCYYLKSGGGNLYMRSELDGMSNEVTFHTDFLIAPRRLQQVMASDWDGRRMDIFGQYENGDYFKLGSAPYLGYEDHFSNIENIPSGFISHSPNENILMSRLIDKGVKIVWLNWQTYGSGKFNDAEIKDRSVSYVWDYLVRYNSGQVSQLNSGYGIERGIFVEKPVLTAYDNLVPYASGVVTELTGVNMSGVNFIWL